MSKTNNLSTLFILCIAFSCNFVFSQSNEIDSLKNLINTSPDSSKLRLYLQISKAYMGNSTDSVSTYADKAYTLATILDNQTSIATALSLKGNSSLDQGNYNQKIESYRESIEIAKKEADLEKAALISKLQEQQLNEANFQLITILLISIITVGFVITFYFLRSQRLIAEREGQELQVEALKHRLFELQLKLEKTEKIIDINQINRAINSPLTESEMEALQLSLEGLPNTEIAEKLVISISTVKFHLRNVYQKLRIKGKKEVFNYVVKSS